MELIVAPNEGDLCSGLDRLAGQVSSALLRAAPDDLAQAVEDALRLIGNALEIDQTILIQLATGDESDDAVFRWVRPDLPAVDLDADLSGLKALIRALGHSAHAVVLERIPESVPVEALSELDADDVRHIATRSAVVVQVVPPGAFSSVLVLGVFGRYQSWPERSVPSLRLLAEILSGALQRRNQELTLREDRAEIARLTAHLADEAPPTLPASALVLTR